MSIENDLYKQLKHLVSTVPSCNFISYEDKKDIVQDCMFILLTKMQDGTLVREFDKIKGYSFLVLKNYCITHQINKKKLPTYDIKWDIAEDIVFNKEEHQDKLKSSLESKIQAVKYNDIQKRIIALTLLNFEKESIIKELNLTGLEYQRIRQGLVNQLKTDFKRKVKYIVKNIYKDSIEVPCYTSNDVKKFLKDYNKRQVSSIILDGLISPDGYYVEKLVEETRGRKKKKQND